MRSRYMSQCRLLLLLVFVVWQTLGQNRTFVIYGVNSPDRNKRLHISALRMGCDNLPERCVAAGESNSKSQNVDQICINMILNGTTTVEYALQYGRLSLEHSVLREISFDDFVSQAWHLSREAPFTDVPAILRATIRKSKGLNPKLKIGITLYEDEIGTARFSRALPADLRASLDVVHFYLMYRSDVRDYEGLVGQVKLLFPNATIVAGAYSYDRIDYVTCRPGGRNCTVSEEIDFFRRLFQIQMRLMTEGVISAIEFFPGEQWSHWDNAKYCKSDRRQECLDHTKTMRDIAAAMIEESMRETPPEGVSVRPAR